MTNFHGYVPKFLYWYFEVGKNLNEKVNLLIHVNGILEIFLFALFH